jgi:hypothetical protein
MKAPLECCGSQEVIFVGVPPSRGNECEKISLRGVGWTPLDGRVRSGRYPNLRERIINIQRDETSGTDLERVIQIAPPLPVGKDTFIDNEVGDTIRYIKEKFGSAPLLKAYHGALDALEESNRRWKEYYEEEARLQSIFEGED